MKTILPSNIKTLYYISFLSELFFIIPIWLLFYLRFITLPQIALLTIIRQFATLFLELPTGALADLWGKKRTLILGFFLYAISLILIPFGKVFWYFVIFEIIRGGARALISGAFEALAYDSLKDINKENYYPTLIGKINTISWIALIIASILGGILYDIYYPLPYIITGVFYLISVILMVLFIKEPLNDTQKYSFKIYIKQTYQGVGELFRSFRISIIVVILAIISLGFYLASELIGPAQVEAFGFNGTKIGVIFSTGYALSAILSFIFPQIHKKISKAFILLGVILLLTLSFVGIKFVPAIIGSIFIIFRIASSSIFNNLRSVYLNSIVSSKNRATALSTFSFLYIGAYSLIAYLAGKYVEIYSIESFTLLYGAMSFVVLILLGVILIVNKHWSNSLSNTLNSSKKNSFGN